MAVLEALRQVPGALARNPIVLVVLGAFGLLQAPQVLAQTVDPLLASLVSLLVTGVFVLVVPFVQAGLIGMVDEALDGRTEFGTFLRAGKQYYLSVLGAYLAVFALSVVLGIVATFAAVFGGILAFSGGATGIVTFLLVGAVFLLVLVPYLLVVFFVQFYGQEIVLDGASAVEGLKRSVGLVRRNLASTAGYTLVVVVVSGAVGGLAGGLSFLLRTGGATPGAGGATSGMEAATLSPTAAVVFLVLTVVASALVGGFMLAFSVAFYREIRGEPTGAAPA